MAAGPRMTSPFARPLQRQRTAHHRGLRMSVRSNCHRHDGIIDPALPRPPLLINTISLPRKISQATTPLSQSPHEKPHPSRTTTHLPRLRSPLGTAPSSTGRHLLPSKNPYLIRRIHTTTNRTCLLSLRRPRSSLCGHLAPRCRRRHRPLPPPHPFITAPRPSPIPPPPADPTNRPPPSRHCP